jgi:hypothetical protein
MLAALAAPAAAKAVIEQASKLLGAAELLLTQ